MHRLMPTSRRFIRPYEKPSFEHTQKWGVNRNHPFATNLELAVLFNTPIINQIDILTGQQSSQEGNPTGAAYSPGIGISIDFDGNGDGLSFDGRPTNSDRDITILAFFNLTTSGGNHRPVFTTGGTTDTGLMMNIRDSELCFSIGGIGNYTPGAAFTITGGVPYLGIVSYDNSADSAEFFLQDLNTFNIITDSVGGTGNPKTGPGIYTIGGCTLYPGLMFYGRIGTVLVWERFMPANEVFTLGVSPSQMLEQPIRPKYYSVPAAVAGHDYLAAKIRQRSFEQLRRM